MGDKDKAADCPWCGPMRGHYGYTVGRFGTRLTCFCCDSHGPIAPTQDAALDAWNRRADIAAVQPMQGVWNKCTFDLSGAGYDCAIKDGDARHGAYGEGQKVFWDGTTINADGLYILSKLALDKRIAAVQPAQARVKPTDAQINSACLSYRHDFGLMTKRNQDDLRFQANEWLIAWQKETRILPTLEPQPDPRDEVIARLVDAAKPFAQVRIKDGVSQAGDIGRTDVTNIRAAIAAAKAVMK